MEGFKRQLEENPVIDDVLRERLNFNENHLGHTVLFYILERKPREAEVRAGHAEQTMRELKWLWDDEIPVHHFTGHFEHDIYPIFESARNN